MKQIWKPDNKKPIVVSYDKRYPQAWLFTLSYLRNGVYKPFTETWHVVQDDIMSELEQLNLYELGKTLTDLDDMHTKIYDMGEGECTSFDISLDTPRTLTVTKII